VYLENRVGALAELCRVIEERSINLLAICAIDTVEEAVLRLVPERGEEARGLLEERGFRVIQTKVLIVELENRPGATGRVAALLSHNGINVDYLYASAHPEMEKAICVFRIQDLEKGKRVLEEHLR
jgi:hypothetical protein